MDGDDNVGTSETTANRSSWRRFSVSSNLMSLPTVDAIKSDDDEYEAIAGRVYRQLEDQRKNTVRLSFEDTSSIRT